MVTSDGGAIHSTGSAYGGELACELLCDTSPLVPVSTEFVVDDVEDAELDTLEDAADCDVVEFSFGEDPLVIWSH